EEGDRRAAQTEQADEGKADKQVDQRIHDYYAQRNFLTMARQQHLAQHAGKNLKDQNESDDAQSRERVNKCGFFVKQTDDVVSQEIQTCNRGESQDHEQFQGVFGNVLQAAIAGVDFSAHHGENALRQALINEQQGNHQLQSGAVKAHFRLAGKLREQKNIDAAHDSQRPVNSKKRGCGTSRAPRKAAVNWRAL